MFKKLSLVLACLLVFSVTPVMAQDFCEGNFDYDQDQDGGDAFTFKTDFGRSQFSNPCPPDGPAPVPKTGQTISLWNGDDGDLEKGVVWPNPRFTDNGDGTVRDNLTGLIWLKNANCFGPSWWMDAVSDSNGLSSGLCGLTDGSVAGDWRLPNINELLSLINRGELNPALPAGHPFINVQTGSYWSSTSSGAAYSDFYPWYVLMLNGVVEYDYEFTDMNVWPVRGGH